jgi:multiple sugar transport system ATP-binding protein
MRAGILQQVGPPQELYDNPVNLFVAGFIGSPAMNFMPASVEGDIVKLPMVDAPLDGRMREALAGAGGLIAGIRPEHFEDAGLIGSQEAHGVTFDAPIDVTESMGSEIYAYFSFQGGEVSSDELAELARDSGAADVPGAGAGRAVARLNPESEIAEGSEARLWFDAAKLHVFSPSDGSNLAHERASAGEPPSVAEQEGEDGGKGAAPVAVDGNGPTASGEADAEPPTDPPAR